MKLYIPLILVSSSAKLFAPEILVIAKLTLLWQGPLPFSYRNQSIDLQSKSMDWFLYDNSLRHERVKSTTGWLLLTISKCFIQGGFFNLSVRQILDNVFYIPQNFVAFSFVKRYWKVMLPENKFTKGRISTLNLA